MHINKKVEPYLWMLPAFLIVSFATIFPLSFAFNYSLHDTIVFQRQRFVGFRHYIGLLDDRRFLINVTNTLFFTLIGIVIALVIGFIISLLIRKPSKINSIYRTIILIPWATNEVVLGLMWTWLLNPHMSIIYYWAEEINISLPNFLGRDLALITVTVLNAWRSLGFSLVMILAAFASIPKELEEACLVDGCNRFQRVWHLILPMIRPVILVIIIILTISFFNIVSFVLVLTGGGPIFATEILSIRLYIETFVFFNISLASVLTTVMLVMNLGFVGIYKKLIREESYY